MKVSYTPESIDDLIIGNDIIRYLIRSNQIDILRIWHYKEDR